MDEKHRTVMEKRLRQAEAVVIGAGAGLSTAAGISYSGKRFQKHFQEFIDRYGMTDMYSAGFYPFDTQEEKWAYWSRHIYFNRYAQPAGKPYLDLLRLVRDKSYFVLTTNVDHQFWLAGFGEDRIFATQGDYGLFQCARACHKKRYDNEAQVLAMLKNQKKCRIPARLVPKCPVCGGDMEVNLRKDSFFVEDEDWDRAAERYEAFLKENWDKNILFLELGVGMNTPGIIKYPFWQLTEELENAFYICINKGQAWAPREIAERSLCVNGDLAEALEELAVAQEMLKEQEIEELSVEMLKEQEIEELSVEIPKEQEIEELTEEMPKEQAVGELPEEMPKEQEIEELTGNTQGELELSEQAAAVLKGNGFPDTQEGRLNYLVEALGREPAGYRGRKLWNPAGAERRNLLRSLMNVRLPEPVSEDFLKVQDAFLQQEAEEKGIVSPEDIPSVKEQLGSAAAFAERISIWQGDITRLRADSIVNAANSQMLGCFVPCHGCIDNCIHSAAGLQLREECSRIMAAQGHEESTGRAKLTGGYNLPCKYVLHTVGPIVGGRVTREDRRLLRSCYEACLELAARKELESIAFCCISTGEFHFPNREAAQIAVSAVEKWMEGHSYPLRVIFNVFKDLDREIYEELLR